jgi:quercetin dioxygenase-like cupin family protein
MTHVPAGAGDAFWVVGDTYTVKASEGGLGLVEASIPPGSGPPPHRHTREDEAFYLLAGTLEITADQETVHAAAGDFVHLPRGTLHSFTNPGADPARALILVTPGGFERFFQEVGAPAHAGTPAPPPGDAELEHLLAVAPRYGIHILAPIPGAETRS